MISFSFKNHLRANAPKNLQYPIESGIMGVIEISLKLHHRFETLVGSKIEIWAEAILELCPIVKFVKCRAVIYRPKF